MKDENKPFNDAIDHFNEIEGNAGNPSNAKINKLPKPLKILWILYDWFHFIIHFVNDFIKFIKLTNTDWWLFLTGALVQEDRGCPNEDNWRR
ncbi:hypothetical protein [Neobacillus sp. SuZ13]|uniref:hypothetical protein n=1 Tax=Neobacillus sp. SuZ13 TaxID=3047875 RepID=UPI0024C0B1C5|nr:hypothetical protein [Neobacillus sp. SuZ13]WHY64441.1 hypothetical protein QNH17_15000 [Neobacillus sp. SuZ13]